jgi:RNA transcription, translation and transport factor protein
MESCRILLQRLGYPRASTLKVGSRPELIHLVTWLEDRKIRSLEVQEREDLRHDNGQWDGKFTDYLDSLECPFQWSGSSDTITDCLTWLIEYAVAAEYEDASENLGDKLREAEYRSASSDAMVVEEDGLAQDDIDGRVDSLGTMLGMSRSKDEKTSGKLLVANIKSSRASC